MYTFHHMVILALHRQHIINLRFVFFSQAKERSRDQAEVQGCHR